MTRYADEKEALELFLRGCRLHIHDKIYLSGVYQPTEDLFDWSMSNYLHSNVFSSLRVFLNSLEVCMSYRPVLSASIETHRLDIGCSNHEGFSDRCAVDVLASGHASH